MAHSPGTFDGWGAVGKLRYDGDDRKWAVELGEAVARWELSCRGAEPVSNPHSSLHEYVFDIEEILRRHSFSAEAVPFSHFLTEHPRIYNINSDVVKLLNALRGFEAPEQTALVLLGVASYILRESLLKTASATASAQAYTDGGDLLNVAKFRLQQTNEYASSLSVDTEALWEILRRQSPDNLSISGLCDLLKQLCRPFTILLVPIDSSSSGRRRLSKEFGDLDQILMHTGPLNPSCIREASSCRLPDIKSDLVELNPHIVMLVGGASSENFLCEDRSGNPCPATDLALVDLLDRQADLKLVVLGGWYAPESAQNVADAVGTVVAWEREATYEDRTNFSHEFFKCISDGATFEWSYKRAQAATKTAVSKGLKAHFLTARAEDARPKKSAASNLDFWNWDNWSYGRYRIMFCATAVGVPLAITALWYYRYKAKS